MGAKIGEFNVCNTSMRKTFGMSMSVCLPSALVKDGLEIGFVRLAAYSEAVLMSSATYTSSENKTEMRSHGLIFEDGDDCLQL